jgi:glycosyltransferase involved in cell wall biosynthesis
VKLLMILPTSVAGGHHALYALAVAQAARDRSWQVDLATPTFQLDYPAGMDLTRVVESTGGRLVDIPCVPNVTPRWNGVLGYVRGQMRQWALVREAGKRAGTTEQYDVAYVLDGDGWYFPCCVMGTPIEKVPTVTVMLRLRFHHSLLTFGAAHRVRMGFVQRAAFERLLGCRLLKAVLTPDLPLAEQYSHDGQGRGRKVCYFSDMGQSIRLRDRTEARKTLGIGEEKRVIICLGGLNDRKGVPELLAGLADPACPEVVSAMLMGSVDAKLSAWIHSEVPAGLIAGGRVWIQDGIYDRQALAIALSAADAVWLGYRDHFQSSSILWEAAQAGLPVLGCHTGLIAWEIRANDLGETVNTDDSAAVARALTRVLCDEEARGRWSRNGRQSGALHTPAAFGECVVNALENAGAHA